VVNGELRILLGKVQTFLSLSD